MTDRSYLIELKHRLETERHLFANIPPDNAVALSREDDRILVTYLDRNGIRSMPCDEEIIKKALQALDTSLTLKENEPNGIRHIVVIVFDHGEALVADVAWDDSAKMTMTVLSDEEIIVLDEHL